jgi:CelD/BcsL family acetyltransferase involved in cellulose biosynthesis
MTTLPLSPDTETLWDEVLGRDPFPNPFYRYTWHANWFATLGHEWEPCILHRKNVIVPLATCGSDAIASGGEEVADYLDAVGDASDKPDAWEQAIAHLKAQGQTSMTLRNIPESSPSLPFFRTLAGATVEQEDTTPHIELPQTWDEYVTSLSRKYRHELRRKIRKFEREHPDATIVHSKSPEDDIESLLALMRTNNEKNLFLTPQMEAFFRGIVTTCRSCVDITSVTVADKTVSSILSMKSKKTVFLYNSGFDLASFSGAGFYLKAMSIREAIKGGYHTYNFLQGDERYKYELGGRDFGVFKVTVKLKP